MAVLFNFTKNKEPLTSFIIASSTLLCCGLILTSLVTEHSSYKSRRDDTSDQVVSCWFGNTEEIKEISARMWDVIRNDAGYAVAFFGAF